MTAQRAEANLTPITKHLHGPESTDEKWSSTASSNQRNLRTDIYCEVMKLSLSLLLAIVLLNGCASYSAALATPSRIADALSDPVRRGHLISRFIESATGGGVAALIMMVGGTPYTVLALLAGFLTSFVVYELILEPNEIEVPLVGRVTTGYYYERGPRDDEVFVNP